MLIPDPTYELVTRSGFAFAVRLADASDVPALADLFERVAHDDLRFRFLSGRRTASREQLTSTVGDTGQAENFIAVARDGTVIASAMLACDAALEAGEVAIAIRADYQRRGVGWEMLEHVARYAQQVGIKTLESLESRENHAAIELERAMSFTAASCDSDPTLVTIRRSFGDVSVIH